MTRIINVISLLSTFLFFVCATLVSAHSSGTYFEQQAGDYLIDIGYSPPSVVAGIPEQFDFSLFNTAAGTQDEFTDFVVLITKDDQTVYSSRIAKEQTGISRLTYTFGSSGSYELLVRYQNGNANLAEATFPVTVESGAGGDSANTIFVSLAALVFGAFAGFFVAKKVT